MIESLAGGPLGAKKSFEFPILHDPLQRRAHGQQGADQLWQWQLAIAGKGSGKLKMPRVGSELRRVDALGELGEKGAEG